MFRLPVRLWHKLVRVWDDLVAANGPASPSSGGLQHRKGGRSSRRNTRLILDALSRAAAEPAGMPLFKAKAAAGLFPATPAARQAAQRCKDDGYLHIVHTAPREICAITDKGRQWLVTQASPRQVLEDFVRLLEERRQQAAELITAARNVAASVESLKSTVEQLRPAERPDNSGGPLDLCADIQAHVEQWHDTSPGDCPLPELFRRLREVHPDLTVGCFHDGLRDLHARGVIYLHPWTGPLYDLPEPPFALMTGHEIAYYASPRKMTG